MKRVACSIVCGETTIHYEMISLKRKSLEIAVYPDQRVVVKVPERFSPNAIEAYVKKRAEWIKKQIHYFAQCARLPKKQFVDGEKHPYLGKQYKLRIRDSQYDKAALKNGSLCIECTDTDPSRIAALLNEWYVERAQVYLPIVLEACWQSFDNGEHTKPILTVRKMKTRWGSLSTKGRMSLNAELIKTPKQCIEYVVMHELCHLVHHNHSAAFYKLLKKFVPDWQDRKHRLEKPLV